MPDPTPPQNHTIVGEDGELLQPDTSVNPDAYADYLATHVHRDPLMFRIRENVRENGCVYLFFAPWILLVIFGLLLDILSNGQSRFTEILGVLTIGLVVMGIGGIGIILLIYRIERFFRSS